MDENAKNEMRNYLSAAGFFVFAVSTLAIGVSYLSGTVGAEQKNITIISTLLLLLVGVLLAVIGKRDLTAITFLMLGSIKLLMLATGFVSPGINIILYLFLLILAVILLTAKDKAKYPLAILIALQALFTTVSYIIPSEEIMSSVIGYTRLILTVIALYYAFACASERICFPCSKILTADQETDFKKSASALGYLTISASMLVWAIYYLFNKSEIVANTIYALDGVYAALLILVSILLFAVAKMRFTPVMFLLAGSLLAVSSVIGATSEFILGILFIVLGIFAVLRTESRILPGLMFVVYGVSYFIGPVAASAGIMILAVAVNGIPALIALYLAVATFSQRKLPLI
ncbi:MAG: hypothetical protein IJD66_03195 [Methanocorpusculum sp.]|nr:hypothetical protein [Methanocorpusculum sp.]MBP3443345.1 hypothetical protein [Methanocorpusculaceae archaeon]MBQ2771633.1 hypothetical protein [Methanocorpusculum sp.]MBQ4134497.1 hypothetical protein [Methanocorpusculum sp.]